MTAQNSMLSKAWRTNSKGWAQVSNKTKIFNCSVAGRDLLKPPPCFLGFAKCQAAHTKSSYPPKGKEGTDLHEGWDWTSVQIAVTLASYRNSPSISFQIKPSSTRSGHTDKRGKDTPVFPSYMKTVPVWRGQPWRDPALTRGQVSSTFCLSISPCLPSGFCRLPSLRLYASIYGTEYVSQKSVHAVNRQKPCQELAQCSQTEQTPAVHILKLQLGLPNTFCDLLVLNASEKFQKGIWGSHLSTGWLGSSISMLNCHIHYYCTLKIALGQRKVYTTGGRRQFNKPRLES